MKSKIINILLILVALGLIIFLITRKGGNNQEDQTIEENTSDVSESIGSPEVIPTPAPESWQTKQKENISFDIPKEYYVSNPVIGGCEDVTSVSTQTSASPTVSIALIYKDGCIENSDVTSYYTKREVKNGYVFQTSSSNPSVLAIFDKIVASVK